LILALGLQACLTQDVCEDKGELEETVTKNVTPWEVSFERYVLAILA
jgi:hypothetical protein